MDELTEKQTLSVVEGLCLVAETDSITIHPGMFDKEAVRLAKLVDKIYTVVHAIKHSSCHDTHQAWREEAVKVRQELIHNGIITE